MENGATNPKTGIIQQMGREFGKGAKHVFDIKTK